MKSFICSPVNMTGLVFLSLFVLFSGNACSSGICSALRRSLVSVWMIGEGSMTECRKAAWTWFYTQGKGTLLSSGVARTVFQRQSSVLLLVSVGVGEDVSVTLQ